MSEDAINVIQYLLPGFLATWIFHGLTPHPKESQFERTIHAVVLTALIQFFTLAVIWFSEEILMITDIVEDTRTVVIPVMLALVLGFSMAAASNSDKFHAFLRMLGITKKTGFPSVWYKNLYQTVGYATFHLKDERRLYGWIDQWPCAGSSYWSGRMAMARELLSWCGGRRCIGN